MRDWAAWRFRSPGDGRRRRLAVTAILACLWACEDDRTVAAGRPLAGVGDEVLDASVVEQVALRDGITVQEARQHVADTLRIVAAARAEQGDAAEPTALLAPHRRAHLLRAARARLWLESEFEPTHRPDDIPADHPLLVKARNSRKHIHPRIHLVCQVIAMPGEDLEPGARSARTADPTWREQAQARLAPLADRLRRSLPADDPDPCELITRWVHLEPRELDDVRFRVESGGFDLKACAEPADGGGCKTPQFVPAWTGPVSQAEAPGFLEPFFTEFGLHLVHVVDILPARSLDDPGTDAYLREQVHPRWQREAFETTVHRLREKRAVRMTSPAEDGGSVAQGGS